MSRIYDPEFNLENYHRYSPLVRELEITIRRLRENSGSLRLFAKHLFDDDSPLHRTAVTQRFFSQRDNFVFRLLNVQRSFDILDMYVIADSEFSSNKLYSLLVERREEEANKYKVPHIYKAHSGGQALDGPWWDDLQKMIEVEIPAAEAKHNEERLKTVTSKGEKERLAHQVACEAYIHNKKSKNKV